MSKYYIQALDSTQLILYCVLIYWLSDQSSLPTPALFQHQDKVIHVAAYFIMAIFALRALRHVVLSMAMLLLSSLIFCSVYGILDEWHQSFVPGRQYDINDWLADTFGAMLLLGGYYLYQLRYSSS